MSETAAPVIDVDDVIEYVARRAGQKYRGWVQQEDIVSELRVYALGEGARRLAKWAAARESRRVYLALFGVAAQFCEAEKATRSGYHPDDVAWYSPGRVATLVPLAMDPMFDGMTKADTEMDDTIKSRGFGPEGGNLLVQVFDVRAALKARPAARHTLTFADKDSDEYTSAVEALSEYLGGDYPDAPGYRRGRRRVMSNAAAQQETQGDW